MAGVKEAEFYVQYMFGNGQQCDMVQKKNDANHCIHRSRKSPAAHKCNRVQQKHNASYIGNFKFPSSTFEKLKKKEILIMYYILPKVCENHNFNL